MTCHTLSLWFRLHLSILKLRDESLPGCLWTRNIPERNTCHKLRREDCPRQVWKSSLHAASSVLREATSPSPNPQYRGIDSTAVASERERFREVTAFCRVFITPRWSLTFPELECFCYHSSKQWMNCFTETPITGVCQTMLPKCPGRGASSTSIPLKHLCLH